MANYYQDFVGLNTFIYETSGWDPDEQFSKILFYFLSERETVTGESLPLPQIKQYLNHIGPSNDDFRSIEYLKNYKFSH